MHTGFRSHCQVYGRWQESCAVLSEKEHSRFVSGERNAYTLRHYYYINPSFPRRSSQFPAFLSFPFFFFFRLPIFIFILLTLTPIPRRALLVARAECFSSLNKMENAKEKRRNFHLLSALPSMRFPIQLREFMSCMCGVVRVYGPVTHLLYF